ncbi:MAG: S4 domain-containing protein [Thiohalomonadaceae bacterium]
MSESSDDVRLDKWLWAARFYKTRALAVEAIKAGHVDVNGSRPKASHSVACGDGLKIRKGGVEFVITVLGLSAQRGSATIAQQLYREDEEGRQLREAQAEERRLAVAAGVLPTRRPDKRQRRQIIRFTARSV